MDCINHYSVHITYSYCQVYAYIFKGKMQSTLREKRLSDSDESTASVEVIEPAALEHELQEPVFELSSLSVSAKNYIELVVISTQIDETAGQQDTTNHYKN